jgi:hypothetical protein
MSMLRPSITNNRKRVLWLLAVLIASLGLTSVYPLYSQDTTIPVIPFAAIRDDALWLFGFSAEPQQVAIAGGAFKIQYRPLVWSKDGQQLYFTLDYTNMDVSDAPFFPVMRTDRTGSPAEIIVPQTSFWYGVDLTTDGRDDVIYARFNEETRYPDVEIDPYGGPQTIFLPVRHDVYRGEADSINKPYLMGGFPQGVDCQGGPSNLADSIYNTELNWRGNPLTLKQTSHGIVHTFTCWGGGTALLDPATKRDELLGNLLRRVQISAGGHTLIGIDDDRSDLTDDADKTVLRYVNLALMETEILPTAAQPDQLAWGSSGSRHVFYSVVTPADVIELTAEEEALINEITVFYGDGARNTVSIRRYNLETGADDEIYTADAYAIGRMTATPDGRYLLFSQIPNADAWVEAALASADPFAEGAIDSFYDQIEPRLMLLDLETGETTLIAERVYWFSLNTAAYLEGIE